MGVILLATIVDIYRLYIHKSIFKTEIQNILIQINDDSVNPSEIENLLHTNLEEGYFKLDSLLYFIPQNLFYYLKKLFLTKGKSLKSYDIQFKFHCRINLQ